MSAAFQVAVAKSHAKDVKNVDNSSMSNAKTFRSKMSFAQRMETDSYNKKINTQLSEVFLGCCLLLCVVGQM